MIVLVSKNLKNMFLCILLFSQSQSYGALENSKLMLASELCAKNIILFGDFTLKNGTKSPVYFDFRLCQSHSALFNLIIQEIAKKARSFEYDVIAGVPYGAVPFATGVGLFLKKPLIMCRKEAKQHGTQRIIEGLYKKGDRCLLIEDVITSGGSILETITLLKNEEIEVTDIIVCMDRQAGGVERLRELGYQVHALFTYQQLLDFAPCDKHKKTDLSFFERAALTPNPVTKKLLHIMDEKKTNLACAADVTTKQELLDLIDTIGSEICLLKTHIDIIKDFNADLTTELRKKAQQYNFLIVEDRKFADIGSTVAEQYTGGIYHIADWADIVIVHSLPGIQTIKTLCNNAKPDQSIFLIAQMSSEENLLDANYTFKTMQMAEEYASFVSGFITQDTISCNPCFLNIRPGINSLQKKNQQGQHYVTPEQAINGGADIIIVGRGIYAAKNPREAAQEYRKSAWHAYEQKN